MKLLKVKKFTELNYSILTIDKDRPLNELLLVATMVAH